MLNLYMHLFWFLHIYAHKNCYIYHRPHEIIRFEKVYSETLEKMYQNFQKLGAIVENMMNEYLDFPLNFLNQFNDDRSNDVLMCWRYPPIAEDKPNTIGREEHQDTNCFTFLLQDDNGGLEYEMDGSWMPVNPMKGSLVVNVGSTIQVTYLVILVIYIIKYYFTR